MRGTDKINDEIVRAAVGLAPFLKDGWDEMDEPEDQSAANSACERLIAAVEALLNVGQKESSAKPDTTAAYAVRNDQGYYVGIWNTREMAELGLAKGQPSHRERVVKLGEIE